MRKSNWQIENQVFGRVDSKKALYSSLAKLGTGTVAVGSRLQVKESQRDGVAYSEVICNGLEMGLRDRLYLNIDCQLRNRLSTGIKETL